MSLSVSPSYNAETHPMESTLQPQTGLDHAKHFAMFSENNFQSRTSSLGRMQPAKQAVSDIPQDFNSPPGFRKSLIITPRSSSLSNAQKISLHEPAVHDNATTDAATAIAATTTPSTTPISPHIDDQLNALRIQNLEMHIDIRKRMNLMRDKLVLLADRQACLFDLMRAQA
ncbi:hypothetical protein HDU81_004072 [Chytriomyces hyalinus]|nr:hypothetical protein HDU81_004072 [Chytriomyces hyalinus]